MQADDRNNIDKSSAHIIHAGSRHLFRYWEALRAERPCPTRDEVEMAKLVQVLPHIAIMQKSETDTWQFRLAGGAVCELLRSQVTGHDVLLGFDSFERDVIGKTFNLAAERLQPALVRMRLLYSGAQAIAAEMLALPVWDDASHKVQLLGGMFAFKGEHDHATGLLQRRELVSARVIWTEHEHGDNLLDQVGRKAAPHLRIIQGGLSGSGLNR